jgi:hypothetical protein
MTKAAKAVKIPTAEWSKYFDRMMFLTRNDADVPRIPFGTLIDIAFAGLNPERRKKVVWYNNLRNDLAHEFDALEASTFAADIKLFGPRWPKPQAQRAALLKCITDYVCKIVFRHAQEHQLPPAPPIMPHKVKDFMDLLAMAKEVENEIVELEKSLAAGSVPENYLNPRPAST